MTNPEVFSSAPADTDTDWTSLRGDCARMVPHWTAPERSDARPVSPSQIHGVSVPARSARLLDALPEYGN
ncbi:hypothetical protein MTQ10_13240 [Streptomyces sp. XM83C]|jgi:hypothetical protein|uniref:Uncharacterized protein n=1 Tax=Streptomyces thermocoprophilus TaxID=78356 RepID=A0ABV5VFK7_9ACTN|nr:hypothetical protein [Streptomyces sp. XM83C]MCK1820548.1 hypothetical protein [Streptomyces sp. XM83C]